MVGERQGNGRGTAWERHGMCESVFTGLLQVNTFADSSKRLFFEVHGSVHRKTMEYEIQLDVTI
jgi:hypothetical protein